MGSRLVQKVSLETVVTCDVCKQSLDYEVGEKQAYVTFSVVPAPSLQIFQQWPLTLHLECLRQSLDSLAEEGRTPEWSWMEPRATDE